MSNQVLLIAVLLTMIRAACGGELSGGVIFNKLFNSTGVTNDVGAWSHPGTIYLRKAAIWVGEDPGEMSDTDVEFFFVHPGNSPVLLVHVGWDHYANPAGINDNWKEETFSPDYITMGPGDFVYAQSFCNAFAGALRQYEVAAYLWWTTTQP